MCLPGHRFRRMLYFREARRRKPVRAEMLQEREGTAAAYNFCNSAFQRMVWPLGLPKTMASLSQEH